MVRYAEMLTRSHSLRSLAHAASAFAIDMPSTHKPNIQPIKANPPTKKAMVGNIRNKPLS
jgi:hypothetical protein